MSNGWNALAKDVAKLPLKTSTLSVTYVSKGAGGNVQSAKRRGYCKDVEAASTLYVDENDVATN